MAHHTHARRLPRVQAKWHDAIVTEGEDKRRYGRAKQERVGEQNTGSGGSIERRSGGYNGRMPHYGDLSTLRKYPFEYEQRAFHYILQTKKWRQRGLPVYDYAEARRRDLKHHGNSNTAPGGGFSSLIVHHDADNSTSYGGEDSEGDPTSFDNPWRHVWVLPQCALNSYMLYPPLFGFMFTTLATWLRFVLFHGGSRPSNTRGLWESSQWVPGDFVVHMAGHKGPNKRELFMFCYEKSLQSQGVMDG